MIDLKNLKERLINGEDVSLGEMFDASLVEAQKIIDELAMTHLQEWIKNHPEARNDRS